MHARAQIRQAFAAVLAGITLPDALPERPAREVPVFSGRARPITSAECPAIAIFARDDEPATDAGAMGPVWARALTVAVYAVVRQGDDDDLVDELAELIETRVGADIAAELGKLPGDGCVDLTLGTSTIIANIETDKSIRAIEINYRLTYRTRAGVPGVFV